MFLPPLQDYAPALTRIVANPPALQSNYQPPRCRGLPALGPFAATMKHCGLLYVLTEEDPPGIPALQLTSHTLPTAAYGAWPLSSHAGMPSLPTPAWVRVSQPWLVGNTMAPCTQRHAHLPCSPHPCVPCLPLEVQQPPGAMATHTPVLTWSWALCNNT